MSPIANPTRSPAPRVVLPRPLKWHQRLAAMLISLGIKSLALTMRYRWVIPDSIRTMPKEQVFVVCAWHNRLALSIPIYVRFSRRIGRTPRLAGLISASKDGSILARVLESFRGKPVRGSTSRRGPQAMRELTTWAKNGYDLAVTPDGPRGPCYQIQPGVISVAQLTGAPILAIGVELPWKWRLHSWDKFQVPIPFGLCRVRFAEPLHVKRKLSEAERQGFLQELAARLHAVSVD